ncbi:MAG: hypothetical protein CM1200mP29_14140 [Verrucomicrobiota bacterium]|nr:MAG: hypothetical protein CM1200mP29_14140 [Verrucomicrobiota bacterium]
MDLPEKQRTALLSVVRAVSVTRKLPCDGRNLSDGSKIDHFSRPFGLKSPLKPYLKSGEWQKK